MRLLKIDYKLPAIIALLVLFRLLHLGGTVDSPHAWRQYDTKQYIEGYYYDDVAFLEPSVCWMGAHKTLILEFPLPEYMVAQLYKIFGPEVPVARLFFLLFFVLAMVYFYKTLQLLFTDWVPEIAVLITGMMPLSLYYSRAIHIDFFAIAFSMAMLYFTMKAIRNKHLSSLIIAACCAIIAFLVKAPYAFYLAIPILVFAYQERQLKWFLWRAPMFLVSIVFLLIWVKFTKATNAKIPDWDFIPNFNKFTEMWYWYFGTMRQRSYWQTWALIGTRIHTEILGIVGSILLVIGLFFYQKVKNYWWTLSLVFGTLLYMAVFFNLNLIHDYYQLPFTLCCGILIAMGLQKLVQWSRLNSTNMRAYAGVLCLLFIAESVVHSEGNYYEKNKSIDVVSSEVRKFSKRTDLIIISYGGLTPQCPLILQPAGRYGWSIPSHDFKPEMAYKLWKEAGATKLAIVYGGYFEGELQHFYEAMPNKKSVLLDDKGTVLYLCDLDFTPPTP